MLHLNTQIRKLFLVSELQLFCNQNPWHQASWKPLSRVPYLPQSVRFLEALGKEQRR